MDKFDRIFQLHTILASRRTAIPLEDLMARLECSKSTLHRTINALKDSLNAPIVYDSSAGGYRYEASGAGIYELPGLWFSARELQALLILQQLLSEVGAGLLEEHLGPVSARLDALTRHQRLNLGEMPARVRFTAIAARPAGPSFQAVAGATLQRRRIWIEYHARSTDERSDRVVSPQRITHYRGSWYLDAWDEKRDALRSFSVDRIVRVRVLEDAAIDLPAAELDAYYASAYGIFGGAADELAVLRFTPERARWVADEKWHPLQQGAWLDDGSYELRIPYHEPRELIMDIMRHGAEVEVMEPPALRAEVRDALARAMARYE